jgi:hypothetical protein
MSKFYGHKFLYDYKGENVADNLAKFLFIFYEKEINFLHNSKNNKKLFTNPSNNQQTFQAA